MSATSSNKGFTLLEILIAVSLLGILAAAVYGSYFTLVRGRERVAEGLEARRELGSTLDLIRREFSSALYDRSDKRLRLVVEDRDHFGTPASTLELTTRVPAFYAGRRESGIVAVRYGMAEVNGRRLLTRSEQDIYFETKHAVKYPQMERISGFLVECYNGSTWVRSWDTSLNNALPRMVRVTVQVMEDGRPISYSLEAPARGVTP